ncbi:MAG: MFS transporter [Candidatus Lokiarchaeota archaeon]|nr:MFS transporter [Candidatus Lokiarchaeota archaeon]
MDKKTYWKIIARNGYTLLIMVSFSFIAIMQYNILPSIYADVQNAYSLDAPVPIMIMEAFIIIIAAFVTIAWAYYIDKINRKKVMHLSILVWSIGSIICAFAPAGSKAFFSIFILGRVVTAFGIGSHLPASYSIMADIVPAKHWSTLAATLALISSLANGIANFIGGFLASMNIWGLAWQFSFALIALLSVGCFILLSLAKFPSRGSSSVEELDPELGMNMRAGLVKYDFRIKKEDLKKLWQIPTNRWLLYASFFSVIPVATLGSFLIYYMEISPFQTVPAAFRTEIAEIFSAMIALGYFAGVIFMGPIIDKLSEKRPNIQPKLAYWGLMVATPLLISAFLFIVPIDYNSLGLSIDPTDTTFNIDKYVIVVSAIFEQYPSYIAYFFIAFVGSMCAGPMAINKNPVLLEVNLPEHQGTSQSMIYLSDQLSKGITNLIFAFQYIILNFLFEIIDLKYIFMAMVLFYIPAIYFWRKISSKFTENKANKRKIISERTEELRSRGNVKANKKNRGIPNNE